MFYRVQNQTIYCLGMHTYVENHKGNDKMNDKVNRMLKKQETQNIRTTISWSGGVRMGKEVSDNLKSMFYFLRWVMGSWLSFYGSVS